MGNKVIRVGFGRKDITPDFSVPLSGYGNSFSRMSQGYLNRLYATCIAITDELNETVLLFTIDIAAMPNEWPAGLREGISNATGVGKGQIMLCATHTHSGPEVAPELDPGSRFYNLVAEQTVAAAVEAMEDRAAAAVKTGSIEVEKMSYVRHYVLDNGTTAGDNFGDFSSGKVVSHTTDADREMQIILFERGEGKKNIIAVNWQAHPTVSSTSSYEISMATRMFLSADYIGVCRSYIESKTDAHFAFFQGAAGNINPKSMIPEENPTNYYVKYGRQVGDFLLRALDNLKEADGGKVKVCNRSYDAMLDHSDDDRVSAAQSIAELWKKTNSNRACREEGKKYDIHSPYHARAIIARSKLGKSIPLEINAIGVGDISFVTVPYEMFCENGKYIKENSPFNTTFVLECANGHASYIASEKAYEYGCYEVDVRRFTKGTAEDIASNLTDMLKELK